MKTDAVKPSDEFDPSEPLDWISDGGNRAESIFALCSSLRRGALLVKFCCPLGIFLTVVGESGMLWSISEKLGVQRQIRSRD